MGTLKHTLDQRKKEFSYDKERAFLTLRLSLTKDSLDESDIHIMVPAICKAIETKKAPVRRVDWVKLYRFKPKDIRESRKRRCPR